MDEQWKLFLDADVQLLSYLLWAILRDLRGNRNRNNSEAFVYYELFVRIQLINIKFPETTGPLLFVLDEAPLQHKILYFGLFQAKTYANGL